MKSNTCFKKNGEPLTVYSSLGEAECAASYVKNRFNLDVIPYKCDRCKHYHHSPKDRQTPSRTCQYCTDSNGKYKKLYKTLEAALRRAEIIRNERDINVDIYPCPCQPGYHFTKG
jgi:hypothetical protein